MAGRKTSQKIRQALLDSVVPDSLYSTNDIKGYAVIEAVRYRNFKRYDDTTLDLSKRLTILVGPNSSGKSSLIKGVLAFKQTYGDPADHAGFIAQGQYVDIGNFVEYAKNHDLKRHIKFVFSLRTGLPYIPWSRNKPVYVEIVHENDPQTSHGRVLAYCVYIPGADQNCSIDRYEECENQIHFKRMNKMDESFRIYMTKSFFDLTASSHKYLTSGGLDYDRLSKQLKSGAVQGKRDNKRGMSMSYERAQESIFQMMFAVERFVLSPLHSALFNGLTERTFALASLREKPVRSMTLTDERQVVGPTGAHTAAVYHYLRQRAVKAGKRHSRIKDDYSRLDSWFRRLKLGNEIEINSWRDLIDLRTKTGPAASHSDSVVDVGVGFSQASPILVQLAAMPDNTMLIIEQPELHLYPWSQTRLGEIICEEAYRGKKRIVIETHSEHLIHGVQLHVSNVRAKKYAGLTPQDIQIVYVTDESKIVPIQLNEYGEFQSDWPDGFFDQTLNVYRTIMENRII